MPPWRASARLGTVAGVNRPLLLASDHAGFALKEHLKGALDRMGVPYQDQGPETDAPVDYPDFARKVAGAVSRGEADRGLLVCGSGQGMAMAANRFGGVRAAVACDPETARLSREHNDANVLTLGARTVDPAAAEKILSVWLETPFAGGRHATRVAKIDGGS
jgi:ribose 5-phosphate isomerase B